MSKLLTYVPGSRSNACIDCTKNGRLCEFCEFMNLPDSQYVPILTEQSGGDHVSQDIQRSSLSLSPRVSASSRPAGLTLETPQRLHSDQGVIAGRRISNTHTAYIGGRFWYCCMCSDGPHLSAIQAACCFCEHIVCEYCTRGFV